MIRKPGRISDYELMLFISHLQVLHETGIPINRSLKLLSEQATTSAFEHILRDIRETICRGETLSASLGKYPEVFDVVVRNVIRVGEAVGDMALVLNKLAEFKRRDIFLRRKIQSHMIYPLAVFSSALIFVLFLSHLMLTNLIPVFRQQEVALPFLTGTAIQIITFFRHPAVLFFSILLLSGTSYILRDFFTSPFFSQKKDRYLWNMPLLGSTVRKILTARFCYHISLLHESGISMPKALAIAADSSGNTLVQSRLCETIESIRQGDPLWESLKKSGIFPDSLLHMVKAGESSGRLSACLRSLTGLYETEVDYSVQILTSAMEPILISLMGVMVAVIIFVALSPLYRVIETLGF